MLVFRYNKREAPSAPYIELKIMPTGQRRKPAKRQAKLDSGASITVIPESLIRRWHIPFVATITVRGYNGHISVRPTYFLFQLFLLIKLFFLKEKFGYKVDILIGTRRFDNLEVTIATRRNILLGRDIMNKLRITLDGMREIVEIHDA